MTTPIPSPCIRNCCLDEDDICLGCFRSLEEILQWGGASERRRRAILARAAERCRQQQLRRSGGAIP